MEKTSKGIKKVAIAVVASIIVAILSGISMFKTMEGTHDERLLKYMAAKKTSGRESDELLEVYTKFIYGYGYGDDRVGAEVASIMQNAVLSSAMLVLFITLIIFLLAICCKKELAYIIGVFVIPVAIFVLPKYEIDSKYKNVYEYIDENIDAFNSRNTEELVVESDEEDEKDVYYENLKEQYREQYLAELEEKISEQEEIEAMEGGRYKGENAKYRGVIHSYNKEEIYSLIRDITIENIGDLDRSAVAGLKIIDIDIKDGVEGYNRVEDGVMYIKTDLDLSENENIRYNANMGFASFLREISGVLLGKNYCAKLMYVLDINGKEIYSNISSFN